MMNPKYSISYIWNLYFSNLILRLIFYNILSIVNMCSSCSFSLFKKISILFRYATQNLFRYSLSISFIKYCMVADILVSPNNITVYL